MSPTMSPAGIPSGRINIFFVNLNHSQILRNKRIFFIKIS